ncbi:hypothetical protein C7M84_002326 [Penaeus vannamei]|uniref:Uncharacterized protein n=1 Tax=Penaeus vannamei TaxID=6689 RepID=A0A423TR46_PENVA|nr:hypothetical protein C7M84_002326 [Penaeus vannamei]
MGRRAWSCPMPINAMYCHQPGLTAERKTAREREGSRRRTSLQTALGIRGRYRWLSLATHSAVTGGAANTGFLDERRLREKEEMSGDHRMTDIPRDAFMADCLVVPPRTSPSFHRPLDSCAQCLCGKDIQK